MQAAEILAEVRKATTREPDPPEKGLTDREWAEAWGISRTQTYMLLKQGMAEGIFVRDRAYRRAGLGCRLCFVYRYVERNERSSHATSDGRPAKVRRRRR